MREFHALFFAILVLVSVHAEAAPRALSKPQLLKEIAIWQEEINDFEDTKEKDTQIRRDWLFRLQFLVERRYDGTESSLIRLLRFMLETDKKGDNAERSDEMLMTERLLEAIDRARERHEPIWRFIKAYVDDVNPSQPPTLEEFSKSRDYINNFHGVTAKTMSPDELEKLLHDLDNVQPETIDTQAK